MLAFTSAQEMLQTTVQLKTPPLPPLIFTTMFCIYTPPRSMKFGPHVGNRCMYHLVYFLYCLLALLVYTNCRNRDTGACANSYCRGRVACGSVVRKSKPSRSGRCAHVASCIHVCIMPPRNIPLIVQTTQVHKDTPHLPRKCMHTCSLVRIQDPLACVHGGYFEAPKARACSQNSGDALAAKLFKKLCGRGREYACAPQAENWQIFLKFGRANRQIWLGY